MWILCLCGTIATGSIAIIRFHPSYPWFLHNPFGITTMNWVPTVFSHPVFLVGIGGAFGSILRYGVGTWLGHLASWPYQFPLATTSINVLGSLIMGCIAGSVSDRTQAIYLLMGVGFCGGFTTFSTFSLELVEQLQRGKIGLAMLECVLNVVLGVGALYVGLLFCQGRS